MKKMFVITLFMLATLAWATAQQPGGTPDQSSGQASSPSSQMPGAAQSQPSTAGSADQNPGQAGMQPGSAGPAASPQVTEGCLGGSNPNYTITDSAGTTYKLNIPPNADTSKLASHVGESVNVAGNMSGSGSSSVINVQGIGKGTGQCPAAGSKGTQSPPKQ
jgi:hypothetical protein